MANNKELEILCDECGLSMELCTELNMLTMRQYPPISKERKQDVEYARKLIRAELQRFADEVEKEAIMKIPMSLRTASSERDYQLAKELQMTKPIQDEVRVASFDHWFVVINRYPYDAAFQTHHMLIPHRESVLVRNDLNAGELVELKKIIQYFIEPNYDVLFDNMQHRRSVTNRYHLHMGVYHKERPDEPKNI